VRTEGAGTSSAYDEDTTVEPLGDGRFAAALTDRWNALNDGPNGGYVVAVALQALRQALPFPDPLVVAASFLRPAAAGRAEVRTKMIRFGSHIATGEAVLVQTDEPVAHIVASFTDLTAGAGLTFILGEPPALAPPEDLRDPLADYSFPGLTLLERIDYRMADLPGWLEAEPSGRPNAEFWMRFKDGRDADSMNLPLLVDAFAPAVADIGALSVTVQLTVHVRARPAPGWLACRVQSRYIFGGYHEEDFEIWDSGGKLVAQSRQLGLVRPR
jgi:acyl-CoA thioesterase